MKAFRSEKTYLTMAAALLAANTAAAQNADENINACIAQGSTPIACETASNLDDAASSFLSGTFTAASISAYIDGVSAETTELYNDTAEQFKWEHHANNPQHAQLAGALFMHAGMNCETLPNASAYAGSGKNATEVVADFTAHIMTCLNALDSATTTDGFTLNNGTEIDLPESFRNAIQPMDQERVAIIQGFTAFLDCKVNQTPTSCRVAAQTFGQ